MGNGAAPGKIPCHQADLGVHPAHSYVAVSVLSACKALGVRDNLCSLGTCGQTGLQETPNAKQSSKLGVLHLAHREGSLCLSRVVPVSVGYLQCPFFLSLQKELSSSQAHPFPGYFFSN